MKPGIRVHIPTGQAGITQRPPFRNPLYTLVKLDNDPHPWWYLTEILTEGDPPSPPTPPRKKRSKARKAKARV